MSDLCKVNEYITKENAKLRERSGSISSDSKLVSFLYELIRDHLPAGKVESIVRESQDTHTTFTNGYLARYAEDLATRLLPEQTDDHTNVNMDKVAKGLRAKRKGYIHPDDTGSKDHPV